MMMMNKSSLPPSDAFEPRAAEPLQVAWLPGRFAIVRLSADAAIPEWASASASAAGAAGGGAGAGSASGGAFGGAGEAAARFMSITRTSDELSIVAREQDVPADLPAERNWIACRVVGTLDFAMVGVLAQLTGALAAAGVSVFAVSTYDTDYLLVKQPHRARAAQALGVAE